MDPQNLKRVALRNHAPFTEALSSIAGTTKLPWKGHGYVTP